MGVGGGTDWRTQQICLLYPAVKKKGRGGKNFKELSCHGNSMRIQSPKPKITSARRVPGADVFINRAAGAEEERRRWLLRFLLHRPEPSGDPGRSEEISGDLAHVRASVTCRDSAISPTAGRL